MESLTRARIKGGRHETERKIATDRKRGKVCPLGSHCNYRILDNCRFWGK